ncbi:MAG TPA: VWA domain-containing protein [Terriglobia bacterium]|nr:VWA domain-containing protein [Terriglobia bacterium]
MFSLKAAAGGLIAWLLFPAGHGQLVSPPAEDSPPAIKVDVSVVNVLASVRDRRGRLVATLEKEDFELREDGKPQQILYFSRETALPLTLGLLVDSSVSQERLIAEEREAAALFFRRVLRPEDAAFLISFDITVDLLQDVTSSIDFLENALGAIEVRGPSRRGGIGSPLPQSSFGGTHLYDAVYLGAFDVLQREAGRKALVIISDGQDQGSQMDRNQAIEAAQRTDTIIYGILFADLAYYDYSSAYTGEDALRKMAEETGGRMFRAKNDRELADAFQQISDELRSQYSIGYTSTNTARDGKYRKIDLRVRRGGLRVQARKGYYAPQESYSQSAP